MWRLKKLLKIIRYELILWVNSFLKNIPGNIGCWIRIKVLPLKLRGKNIKIWDNVQIDSPSKLSIGDNCSINRGCIINCGGGVEIGDNVLIGPNVVIYSQNHNYCNLDITINKQGYTYSKVKIGNNVWIGANVIILPGTIIEDNVVIGAGSVVNKVLQSDSVYVGNPIRNVRTLNKIE